jgi:TetR/AcrR family transcriptional regulator, tetracycline repressor protein
MASEAQPGPQRRMGRPPRIDRERILAAAREVEAHQLNMPGLAAALGVTTAALYHYFPNKQALVDELADETLGGVELPSPRAVGWREWLDALATAFREICVRNPAVMSSHQSAAIRGAASRVLDDSLEVLLRDGFSREEAFAAHDAALACASYGAVVNAAMESARMSGPSAVRDLVEASSGELRHKDDIVALMGDQDELVRFRRSLDLVLDGIAARRPPGGSNAPGARLPRPLGRRSRAPRAS